MKPKIKGVQRDEKHSTDTRQQPDAFQGTSGKDGKGGSQRRTTKKALAGAVTVEWNPAILRIRLNSRVLASVLAKVGVSGWNDLMRRLLTTNLVDGFHPVAPTPVSINFRFGRAKMSGWNLDGIDLRWCEIEGADLSGCRLRKAMFSDARHVNFEGADLRGALFDGTDLTGACFNRAKTKGMCLEKYMGYDAENPPAGFPAEMLAQCTAWGPDHWKRRMTEKNSATKIGR